MFAVEAPAALFGGLSRKEQAELMRLLAKAKVSARRALGAEGA
jgi:hypothetical protein